MCWVIDAMNWWTQRQLGGNSVTQMATRKAAWPAATHGVILMCSPSGQGEGWGRQHSSREAAFIRPLWTLGSRQQYLGRALLPVGFHLWRHLEVFFNLDFNKDKTRVNWEWLSLTVCNENYLKFTAPLTGETAPGFRCWLSPHPKWGTDESLDFMLCSSKKLLCFCPSWFLAHIGLGSDGYFFYQSSYY